MFTDYVFDLNVLFHENYSVAIRYVDKLKLVKYTARGRTPKMLRKEYEAHLRSLEGQGLRKPLILEKWLIGKYTWKQCHEIVSKSIQQLLEQRPKSTTVALMRDISEITFNPDILQNVITVDGKVRKLITDLYNDGKRIYICGNMDKRTFTLLQNVHKDVFDKVTGSFISGDVGLLKPSKDYYGMMVREFGINPFKTYIVDCDKDDLEDARAIGFVCGRKENLYGNA